MSGHGGPGRHRAGPTRQCLAFDPALVRPNEPWSSRPARRADEVDVRPGRAQAIVIPQRAAAAEHVDRLDVVYADDQVRHADRGERHPALAGARLDAVDPRAVAGLELEIREPDLGLIAG